jgi:hypothetical protein
MYDTHICMCVYKQINIYIYIERERERERERIHKEKFCLLKRIHNKSVTALPLITEVMGLERGDEDSCLLNFIDL